MTFSASVPSGARLHGVDHLRAGIVFGLIPFHTARLFDSDPWHIKLGEGALAADLLIGVFNLFGMPALFLIAGLTAYHSLARRGGGEFLQERVMRLFVPLVLGSILLVAPQVYVERLAPLEPATISALRYDGMGYGTFLSGFFKCCYTEGDFSYHHLWFLLYLFLYSLLLLPVFLWLRGRTGRHVTERLGRAAAAPFGPVLLGLPILTGELMLRRDFPNAHDVVNDWANHAHYLPLVLIGWLVAGSAQLRARIGSQRRLMWIAAVSGVAILLSKWTLGWTAPFEVSHTLRIGTGWLLLLALLGSALSVWDRPNRRLNRFSAISMPVYMLHQTLIVLFGFALIGAQISALAAFFLIAVSAFVASVVLALLAGKTAIGRLVLGITSWRRLNGDDATVTPRRNRNAKSVGLPDYLRRDVGLDGA